MGIEGKSLHVLTPMYGGINYINYFQSIQRLVHDLGKYGVPYSLSLTYNESLITRARNRLADIFRKNHQETHAVYIDADIGFEANDLLHMLELDLDVAGAPCSKKNLRWDRVQQILRRNGRTYSGPDLARGAGDFVVNFEPFHGKREMNLLEPQEVRHVGTGLMMVRRNVFEKFADAYPDRWYEARSDPDALPGPIHDFFRAGINPDSREYDSEDYCFCADAKAIGFKVWVCPWMKTTHMGTHSFVGDMPAAAALAGEL